MKGCVRFKKGYFTGDKKKKVRHFVRYEQAVNKSYAVSKNQYINRHIQSIDPIQLRAQRSMLKAITLSLSANIASMNTLLIIN